MAFKNNRLLLAFFVLLIFILSTSFTVSYKQGPDYRGQK